MHRATVTLTLLSGALGCSTSSPPASPDPNLSRVPVSIEFRLARSAPADAYYQAIVHSTGDTVYLNRDVELNNQHIARAEAVEHLSELYVNVWFTEAGDRRFAEVKAKHVGDHMAVLINENVLGLPSVIHAPHIESVDMAFKPMPLTIALPLEPGQARDLAAAITRTWPRGAP